MAVRRLSLTNTAALLAVGAAACGSSSSATPTAHPHRASASPTVTASPPFSLPGSPTAGPTAVPTLSGNPNGTYSVTVSLTGTDSARGSFTEPVDRGAASPCPPPSQLTGAVSGQRVQVEFAAPAMSGPQTLSPGDLLLTVGSHTWGVASASNAPHGTSGSLQRNPDGSGSLRFQNLALQTNFAQQPQENGSITWTCA